MSDNTNARQYLRRISVSVEDLGTGKVIELIETGAAAPFSGFGQVNEVSPIALRTVFHIERGDIETPNVCDLRIYNMSMTSAKQVKPKQYLTLQAGYDGNYGIIFQGEIKQARIGREEQKDSYIDITAADGDEAYNYSATALSMAANTRPGNLLKAFIFDMLKSNITLGHAPTASQNGSIRGKSFFGMSRDHIREWAAQNDCTWSIQDGQVQIIPKLSYIPSEFPVLSVDSGLLGVPEQTDQGIEMRVLLNPSIKIGQCVKLDNKSAINKFRYGTDILSEQQFTGIEKQIQVNDADGLYYVMNVTHYGDTRGEPWYSDLICLSVDATRAPSDDLGTVSTATGVISGSPGQ